MSLDKVYAQAVQGKSVRGIPTIGSAAPPVFERDPGVQRLERDVFTQLQEIIKPEPLQQGQATPDVQFVSLEDAIRELQQMNNGN